MADRKPIDSERSGIGFCDDDIDGADLTIAEVLSAVAELRLSSAFIGASRIGSTASALPERKELTQRTSRTSLSTWLNDSRMPTISTPTIRPFRPGLLRKATDICRYSAVATNAAMARKIIM